MVLRAQLDADSPEKPVKPVLPLGIIPAGETENLNPFSGNSVGTFHHLHIFTGTTDVVSCSVHGVRDPVTAALHIILGKFSL